MYYPTEHITNFQFIEDTKAHPWFESLAAGNNKDINAQIDEIMLEKYADPRCFAAFFRETNKIRDKIDISKIKRKSFTYTKNDIQ